MKGIKEQDQLSHSLWGGTNSMYTELRLAWVYLKNWQIPVVPVCLNLLHESWCCRWHCASLAPPVFPRCVFGCTEPHTQTSSHSQGAGHRKDRKRHPLAGTLNENLWVISLNMGGHGVHELPAWIFWNLRTTDKIYSSSKLRHFASTV